MKSEYSTPLSAYIPVAIVFFGFIFIIYKNITRILRNKELRSQDFVWYKNQFPTHVNGTKVSCKSCHSTNIGTERLMHKSYLRAHLCRTCGTTLYHSPESK